jgi:hypothetical protein
VDFPNQQHPLSHVMHQPPTLSLRMDGASGPPPFVSEEPTVNFKTYFNTL